MISDVIIKNCATALVIVLPFLVQGQAVLLQNPSFEDVPGNSRTPRGWFYCGEPGETPTDVHPAGIFGVMQPAQHGMTYIGMVARATGTREGISQWLREPLAAERCYRFSVRLARSANYRSISRVNWQMANFNEPVRLLIWGGNVNCERQQLLAESPLIEHTDWQSYHFRLQPRAEFSRLLLEVDYAEGAEPYRGNLLLDHASPVVPENCENGAPAVDFEKIKWKKFSSIQGLQIFINKKAADIQFSALDHQLEQHIFHLPSGELEQANRHLYRIVKSAQATGFRKLKMYIPERDKKRWQTKAERVAEALRCMGVSYGQYRIKRSRGEAVEIKVK